MTMCLRFTIVFLQESIALPRSEATRKPESLEHSPEIGTARSMAGAWMIVCWQPTSRSISQTCKRSLTSTNELRWLVWWSFCANGGGFCGRITQSGAHPSSWSRQLQRTSMRSPRNLPSNSDCGLSGSDLICYAVSTRCTKQKSRWAIPPTRLPALVRPVGFEPTAFGSATQRSIP